VVIGAFAAHRHRARTALNDYVLASNIENLRFTGNGDFTGIGNELANVFTGGAGDDFRRRRWSGHADGRQATTLMWPIIKATGLPAAGQVRDTVLTTLLSYTLGANSRTSSTLEMAISRHRQ
jgi:hypothetical protein